MKQSNAFVFILILIIKATSFAGNIEFTQFMVGDLIITSGDFSQTGNAHYQNLNLGLAYKLEKMYFGFGYSLSQRDYVQLANSSQPTENFFSRNEYYFATYGIKSSSDKNVVAKANFNLGYVNYNFNSIQNSSRYTSNNWRLDVDARLEYHLFIFNEINIFPFIGGGLSFRNSEDFTFQNVSYKASRTDNPRFNIMFLGGFGFGF